VLTAREKEDMFTKILIANRGEIALRIIRACREMGIETTIVYSKQDRDSLPVKFAHEAVCIGEKASKDSYLKIPAIISAAEVSGAEAIHPGYGFLSENAEFAQICRDCNIIFIGPPPEAIEKMGDKSAAKETMKLAGVPVVPGSEKPVRNEKEAVSIAQAIGYPVMIKASAGGGGRGIRIAYNRRELLSHLGMAQSEAQAAFGNSDVYIEKYIERGRHIEFQVLADRYGNVVHLGERDCSIQRRHQKLIEETPSPVVDEKLREKMGEAAVLAARAVNYTNAGTVEFLMDKEGKFYFMEMNTRLQVEHPITEEVYRVDLVKEQIRIAAGERLRFSQKDVRARGHSIECRINAEDPFNNFMPSPGEVVGYAPPAGPGIRLDSHLYQGYTIPPVYDSLIGKLIVQAEDRESAIARMKRALEEFIIEGIKTTIPFHLKVLNSQEFQRGEYWTKFIETKFIDNS
jgi:acetyl-CoA carboxylase biotin carboxylase subunit